MIEVGESLPLKRRRGVRHEKTKQSHGSALSVIKHRRGCEMSDHDEKAETAVRIETSGRAETGSVLHRSSFIFSVGDEGSPEFGFVPLFRQGVRSDCGSGQEGTDAAREASHSG